MCDAFVHGIVYSFVGFAAPIGEVVGVLFNQFAASVCAATVDYNPFVVNDFPDVRSRIMKLSSNTILWMGSP